LADADPVPADVVTGARAAFIARDLDRELTALVYDSAVDESPVLMRGDTARSLSFATERLRFELELHVDPARIVGQLVPSAPVALDLELNGAVVATTATDDLGRFRFDDVPTGHLSIVCRTGPGGRAVCTVEFEL
jgi:hypothetical protein